MMPSTSSYVDLHRASLDPASSHFPFSSRYSDSSSVVGVRQRFTSTHKPTAVHSSSIAIQTDNHLLLSGSTRSDKSCSDDVGCMMTSSSSATPYQHNNTNLAVEIDKIMAKIDRDNRVLAQLDKTHSTTVVAGGKLCSHIDLSLSSGF